MSGLHLLRLSCRHYRLVDFNLVGMLRGDTHVSWVVVLLHFGSMSLCLHHVAHEDLLLTYENPSLCNLDAASFLLDRRRRGVFVCARHS